MRVEIRTIIRNIGSSIEIKTKISPEEIELSYQDIEFTQDVEFEGSVTSADKDLMILKGIAGTVIKSQCARCLKDVETRIVADINATFKSHYQRDTDLTREADPEEEYTYEGYSIELDKVLKDSLILALPSKFICSEDCKGFCEWCGNNLNEKDCKCKDEHASGNSLFEKLRNLL